MSSSSKKKMRKEQEAVKMTEKQLEAQKEAKKVSLYTALFIAAMVLILVVAIVVGVNQVVTNKGIRERKTEAMACPVVARRHRGGARFRKPHVSHQH